MQKKMKMIILTSNMFTCSVQHKSSIRCRWKVLPVRVILGRSI